MPIKARTLVSIINWNNNAATNQCLASIARLHKESQPDIILTDNNSIKEKFTINEQYVSQLRSIEIKKNKSNLGFAGGHNYSLQFAVDNKYDYVFILNNDAELLDIGVFNSLAKALSENEQAIAAAPTILSSKDPKVVWFAGGELSRALSTPKHNQNLIEAAEPQPVTFLTGCCLAFKVSALRQFGVLLPENYFMYWEDADWCAQAKRAGYELLYVPGSTVLHEVSSSLGLKSAAYAYYITRNNLLFIRRNTSVINKPLSYARVTYVSLNYLIKSIVTRKATVRKTFSALKSGWLDGLRGRGGERKVAS